MVLEYLPTKLGNKNEVNVGVHIPAPWFAHGYHIVLTAYMEHMGII